MESMSKIAGSPGMLDTKSALLEAPVSRGQWVRRSALKLPGFRLRGQWAGVSLRLRTFSLVLHVDLVQSTVAYQNTVQTVLSRRARTHAAIDRLSSIDQVLD